MIPSKSTTCKKSQPTSQQKVKPLTSLTPFCFLESLVYSCIVLKKKLVTNQQKTLIITSNYLFLLKGKEFNRTIKLSDVRGLTKSVPVGKPKNLVEETEFIIHIRDQYDMRYFVDKKDKRDDLFVRIKAVYFSKYNRNLPCYDCQPAEISKYELKKDQ